MQQQPQQQLQLQQQQLPPAAPGRSLGGTLCLKRQRAAASAAGGTLPFPSMFSPRQTSVTFAGVPPDRPLAGPSVSGKHRPLSRQRQQQEGATQEQGGADLVSPKDVDAAGGRETGEAPGPVGEGQPRRPWCTQGAWGRGPAAVG